MKSEYLEMVDCAFKAAKEKRSIRYLAHIAMMAAAQSIRLVVEDEFALFAHDS